MADEQAMGAIELATDLTIAWLGNPHTRASVDDVDAFLSTMHRKLGALSSDSAPDEPQEQATEYTPAVLTCSPGM